jgi:hypothetical protein
MKLLKITGMTCAVLLALLMAGCASLRPASEVETAQKAATAAEAKLVVANQAAAEAAKKAQANAEANAAASQKDKDAAVKAAQDAAAAAKSAQEEAAEVRRILNIIVEDVQAKEARESVMPKDLSGYQKFVPVSFSAGQKEYVLADGKWEFMPVEGGDPFLKLALGFASKVGKNLTLYVKGDLESGQAAFVDEATGTAVLGSYEYKFTYGDYWVVFSPAELRAPGILGAILSSFELPEAYYFKGSFEDGVLKAQAYAQLDKIRWVVTEAEYK